MHDATRAEWIADALARFEAPLLRFATKLLRDGDRARDVVQETFLQLCQQDRTAIEGHLGPKGADVRSPDYIADKETGQQREVALRIGHRDRRLVAAEARGPQRRRSHPRPLPASNTRTSSPPTSTCTQEEFPP